jgi:hypothetical protein
MQSLSAAQVSLHCVASAHTRLAEQLTVRLAAGQPSALPLHLVKVS